MGLNFEVWISITIKNTSKIPQENSKSQIQDVPHRKHCKHGQQHESERKLQKNTNAAKITHIVCIVFFNEKLNAVSHGCTYNSWTIFETWLLNI